MLLTMPLTLIIWFMLLISGCVQQQQPHVELQLPVDYHGRPYRAGLDRQESTSYTVADNNITLSTALDTSASDQNSSSTASFRATSSEFGTNHGNSTATAKRLSSTDEYNGASSTNLWSQAETENNISSRSTASTERGTNGSRSPATDTLRASTGDGVGASTTKRLIKTKTDTSTTYWSTSSPELRTNSGSSTVTLTLRSSTGDYAASSTSRLTKIGADIGKSSRWSARGTELFSTSGRSSAINTKLSCPVDCSGAMNADGDTNIHGGKQPVDRSQPWRLATGALVLIVTLLVVILVILMMCGSVRRCILRRIILSSDPGDIDPS